MNNKTLQGYIQAMLIIESIHNEPDPFQEPVQRR